MKRTRHHRSAETALRLLLRGVTPRCEVLPPPPPDAKTESERRSAAAKLAWADPEKHKSWAAAVRRGNQKPYTDQRCDAISAGVTAAWADPEKRSRMAAKKKYRRFPERHVDT
jgi:hypothetical protein